MQFVTSGVTRVGVTGAATDDVTPIFFFKKTDDLFSHQFYYSVSFCSSLSLFLFHSGITQTEGCHSGPFFYLSHLVSPLFFVNSAKKNYSGVTPWRSPGAVLLVTPLFVIMFYCACPQNGDRLRSFKTITRAPAGRLHISHVLCSAASDRRAVDCARQLCLYNSRVHLGTSSAREPDARPPTCLPRTPPDVDSRRACAVDARSSGDDIIVIGIEIRRL